MTNTELTAENEALKGALQRKEFLLEEKDFIIAKLQKMLFGPTSEKQKKGEEITANQIDLFTAELAPEQIPTVKEVISYTRTKPVKKTPSKRVPLPVDLPRIPIIIEPEEDTTGMVKIGEEITEVLDIIPPVFRVLQIIRPKYARPQAATQDIAKPIVVAPMPSRVIDKGIPSARLLAYIIIGKFIQHLPYYRQIQIFQRVGVNIKSNTINGWIQRVCVLLKSLYDAFCQQQFAKNYLQADETKIKFLLGKKKGKNTQKSSNQTKNKASTGYFWVYFDPKDKHVVFIFNPGRGEYFWVFLSQQMPRDSFDQDLRGDVLSSCAIIY